tara:strand:+ start:61 stop:795 length:735 start_codon:yes stop_codon:yes gene_type:complete
MSNLKNMRVVITGASSGFGSVAAKLLVGQGCKVTLGARRKDRLKELVTELGDSSTYEVTDVKKKDDLDKLVQKSIDTFDGVDAIINNAGIMPLSLISAGRTDEWDEMIDVNIKGVLYGTNAVYKHFINQGHGKIINISSVAGKRVMPGSAVYSGTKYAVRAISEGTRIESSGVIQVTCIYPGAFKTELASSIKDESMLEALIKRGVGAVAQPAEKVADAIKYALEQDHEVSVNEIVIRPTAQDA